MKIGFIGLGTMGKPMAKDSSKAGFGLVVCDVNEAAVQEVVSCGVSRAESGTQVATQCEAAITTVPDSPQVRAVTLRKKEIIEGVKPGTVLIDTSSIDPMRSQTIGAELARKRIKMMDCPVPGGGLEAIDGILFVMCGGKKELFDKYYNMLVVMAGSTVYVGELGSSNVARPAIQIVATVNIAAVSKALAFAKKVGTDPELVYQTIRGDLTDSTVMDARAPMMLDGNYQPGFRLELHIKDLNNALNTVHTANTSVPLTGQLVEIVQSLETAGCKREDRSALVKYYEKIAGEMAHRDGQYLQLMFDAGTFIM